MLHLTMFMRMGGYIMILCVSDVHLGHKLYSSILDDGLTDAEEDTRAALNKIAERASEDDIEMIICAGDFFHTARPSTENVRWVISWFKEMDALGKPFYVIPGNHDISTYSNSLVFLKSLKVNNIFLIDQNTSKITWGDWSIYFVPFLVAESSKDKYATTVDAVKAVLGIIKPEVKNIIVTHIQESSSKIGSENTMLSRGVETINMDNFFDMLCKKTILLTGHMHMHQIYTKNDITIVYPGSLTYMDSLDCGQRKGYVLLDYEGNITFEEVQGVRKYKQYILPKGKDPVEFFSTIRMSSNEIVFLKSQDDAILDDSVINTILTNRNCKLAKISYTFDQDTSSENETLEGTNDPFILLEEWVMGECKDNQDDIQAILKLGREFLTDEIKCD